MADRNLQDAITLSIMYIGEALGHTTSDFRLRHPSLPWTQAIGMRNRIAHDYDRVGINDVWTTATKDLLEPRALILNVLSSKKAAA